MENENGQLYTQPVVNNPLTAEIKPDKPIGGWLFLLAIGMVLNPIVVLFSVARNLLSALKPETVQTLLTQGTAYYNPPLLILVIVEIVFNVLIMLAYIYMLVIFFGKKKNLPIVFIVVYLTNLVFVIADTAALYFIQQGSAVYKTETSYIEIIQRLAACAIWIPYMIYSKRVKETFVKK
jgi:hypothetical protein